jgi:hypothetical protein
MFARFHPRGFAPGYLLFAPLGLDVTHRRSLDGPRRTVAALKRCAQSEREPLYLDAKGEAFLEAYSSAQQEGRRQAGRDLALRQATRRFGPHPDAAHAIASTVEPAELEFLANRIFTVTDWPSLLASLSTASNDASD